MKIKKTILIFYSFVLLICLSIMPMSAFAAETNNSANLAAIIQKSGAVEVPESQYNSIDNEYIILTYNNKIYKAEPQKLFKALKETHGDEHYLYSDKSDVKWKDISTYGDNKDAKNFGKAVGSTGGVALALMKHTVKPILTFQNDELNVLRNNRTIMPGIGAFAFSLCLLYGLMDLMSKSARDQKSLQNVILMLFKVIMGILMIQYSAKLVGIAFDLNNGMINLFADTNAVSMVDTDYESLKNIAMKCDQDGYWESLFAGTNPIESGIGSLLLIISIFFISVACYARKIEMLLRAVFLPIALADVSGNGMNGRGMNYLKKFFGIAIQGALIIFMITIAATYVTKPGLQGMASFTIPIAIISSVQAAKSIAEEAMAG